MIRRCPGWGTEQHEPKILGQKEPLADRSITDTLCGDCRIWFKQQEIVSILALMSDGRVISYTTDRLGAALRLRCVRRLPTFVSHTIKLEKEKP